MTSISKGYDAVTAALCVGIAGVSLVFTCAAVLYDVFVRTAGLQPPIWTSASTEYAMLVLTMAIAPQLVRSQSHVRIELLSRALPDLGQTILHRIVSLAGFAICLIVSALAVSMGWEVFGRGELDIRSIELPRWILFAILASGFGLCAIEFLRQALAPRLVAQDATGGL